MQRKELRICLNEYFSISELPDIERKLIYSAREASQRAFAPYSKFKVGAAILLSNGEMVTGNNQENAASPLGLCAERVALFYAQAKYPGVHVDKIAITATNSEGRVEEPVKPCGACRQALMESEIRFNNPIKIILEGKKNILVFEGVSNLLPFPFKPESLD